MRNPAPSGVFSYPNYATLETAGILHTERDPMLASMRDQVIAALESATPKSTWRNQAIGQDAWLTVGSDRSDRVTLQGGHFNDMSEHAAAMLETALKKVQKPRKSGDTLTYISLQTGKQFTVSLTLIRHVKVLTAPETREKKTVNAVHYAAASTQGLVAAGTEEHHIILTDEGRNALKIERIA